MQFTLVRTLREHLPNYGRANIKSFLGTVFNTVFVASILSKNYLIQLSTKSGR